MDAKHPGVAHDIAASVINPVQQLRTLIDQLHNVDGGVQEPDFEIMASLVAQVEIAAESFSETDRFQAKFVVGSGHLALRNEDKAYDFLLDVVAAPHFSIEPVDHISAILLVLPLLCKRSLWEKVQQAADKARNVAGGRWVDASLPFAKGVALAYSNQLRPAAQCFREAIRVDRRYTPAYIELDSILSRLGDFELCRRTAQKLVDKGCYWVNCWQRPQHFLVDPAITSMPWHDAASFQLVQDFESNFPAIQCEVAALLSEDIPWGLVGSNARGCDKAVAHDGLLVKSGEWHEIVLLGNSQNCNSICERCPTIFRILEACPAATHAAKLGLGESLLSRLKPGTHLNPHCGPTNMRLTCHLGIIVPLGATITCGGQSCTWEEGKCLVFDDSYEHEVSHVGTTDRVVLLVNFWHPDLAQDRWETLAHLATASTV